MKEQHARNAAAPAARDLPAAAAYSPSGAATAGRLAAGRRGLLAAALARAHDWLVEPATPVGPAPDSALAGTAPRPVVAVAGVAPGCGATTLARALAAELAGRDPGRSCVAAGADSRGGLPIGTPSAARLARAVAERAGAEARPSGRLCLAELGSPERLERAVRDLAPLVFDAAVGAGGSAAVSLAGRTLLVAAPHVEPSLAEIVAASLARIGPEPVVVLNRTPPADAGVHAAAVARWAGRARIVVPESRAAAHFALAGRGAGGAFGAAVAELADLCEKA